MTSKKLIGAAVIVMGVWMILAAQWGLEVKGGICWMWWVSMGLGLAIVILGTLSIIFK